MASKLHSGKTSHTSSTTAASHSAPVLPGHHNPAAPAPTFHQSNSYSSNYDEKNGDAIVEVQPVSSPDTHSPAQHGVTPLDTFRGSLGIPPPKPTKPSRSIFGRKKQPPPSAKPQLTPNNIGVYESVMSCERWARFRYHFTNSIVTIAMFLQIIVGASVTAFGAGSANHIIITVFGAANTALASLLAVLKSQGLPNRMRQDWNGWRELREYIEEKEREIEMVVSGRLDGKVVGLGKEEDGCIPVVDVWATVKDIEERYSNMRLTCEANR